MIVEKIKQNKFNLLLIFLIFLVLAAGYTGYRLLIASNKPSPGLTQEIDLKFDPEGPYALLLPRSDGNALDVRILRTSSYDEISYELAYSDIDGIDRGVTGEIKVEEKSEYSQEVLFGTCSKNVCKYDKGVKNGTLTLRIKDKDQRYKMITQWHIQNASDSKGELSSGDGHFRYRLNDSDKEVFTVINDLTGAPRLPNDKQVLGKVYSLNVSSSDQLSGNVTIDLADNPPSNTKIFRWNEPQNNWEELQTNIDGATLTAKSSDGGIFAVLAPK